MNEEIRSTGIIANPEPTPERRAPLRFEDVITSEHLQMISRTSGGFHFAEDRSLPPNRVGYTNKETKVIYYNPQVFNGSPEHGIPPANKNEIRGFVYHEAGHHTPVVVELEEKLVADLANPDIIPESYRGNPRSEQRFVQSLWSNLDNALLDVWLESYMGRRPYFPVRTDIEDLYSSIGIPNDWLSSTKPEQLIQTLLISRYKEIPDLDKKVDPDVHTAFERIHKSGAMSALLDRRVYESPFATKSQEKQTIDRKYQAYKQVFLPEYLQLMESELEERKQEKSEEKGKGGSGAGQGEGTDPVSSAVPLTNEEEQEIITQILDELDRSGQKHSDNGRALSDDEREHLKEHFDRLRKRLEDIKAGKDVDEDDPSDSPGKKGIDAIADEAERMRRAQKREDQQGLAGDLQVREQSVAQWEQIKEKRADLIDSLATSIVDIFVDDRRKRTEYLLREGEIVPGLEYETIAAMLSGDLDPQTKMQQVRNPEFLETEHEDIVDTSGSMSGLKLKMSVELEVIKTEAFKRAREILDAELLVLQDEDPLRVGVTKFSDKPERVTELDEPITDAKQIKIIDKVSMVGGGTDETEALDQVYKGLRLRKNNVLKFITVLTDGQGNRDAVAPIMRQIEQDDEVIFLVVALGDDAAAAQAIIDTYIEPLRDREKNIFAISAVDPEDILPQVVEFYKREVEKRRTEL